jgi:hypothetical protein
LARQVASGRGELLEDLLAGEVLGFVLEAVPGGLFIDEDLLGEGPASSPSSRPTGTTYSSLSFKR